MTVSAIYTSAPGEAPGELGPNDFKAGSRLTLKCSVEGYSGGLSYSWSVTGNPSTPGCYSCNIGTSSTTSLLVLGRLHSFDAGNYTCDVSETGRPASSNSGNFSVTIFGEFYFRYHDSMMIFRCWNDCSSDITRSHSQQRTNNDKQYSVQ